MRSAIDLGDRSLQGRKDTERTMIRMVFWVRPNEWRENDMSASYPPFAKQQSRSKRLPLQKQGPSSTRAWSSR
jgi:hypothetical protein